MAMIARSVARRLLVAVVAAAGIAGLAAVSGTGIQGAKAQQQPSPAAVALSRQILELKGGLSIFDPVIVGVVEHHKNLLVQVNPTAASDLEPIAQRLRKDLQPRLTEVHDEIARGYAEQFTVAELKELLTFYKSPLGKKVIEGEPKALDTASGRVEAWAEKLASEVTATMRNEMKKKGHNLL